WVNKRSSCAAPFLPDCHNNAGYKRIFNTSDPVEAGNYFTTESINNWECNDGYNATLDQFYCKLSIHNSHEAELQKCENTVISEFNHGFNCSYTVEYVNCMTKVYLQYCGVAAGRWGCNIAEVAMKADVPMCVASLPACGSTKFEQPDPLDSIRHPKRLV
uniref:VWFD domain-containing protein n=1 Tax=Panagrolaimus sp. JU765 TaxID=591449 RepID=A0AC34PVW0_9BILA